MISFDVKVPFTSEATSIFKSVTDVFSYIDDAGNKINSVIDEIASFSIPVTLGVFRVLLDGQCQVIDRDFESKVALVNLNSKDRGGKGKLDARVRLRIDETESISYVVCECEVLPKGMLARVSLPIEPVFSRVISKKIEELIKEQESLMPVIELESPEAEAKAVDSQTPLWILILRLPSNILMYPYNFVRDYFRR